MIDQLREVPEHTGLHPHDFSLWRRKDSMRSLIVAALLSWTPLANAQAPAIAVQGFIDDRAGALDSETRQELDAMLQVDRHLNQRQIAVLILPTIGDKPIETVALEAFNQRALGNKDRDDGVLLVLALQERRMRIEVGYGLEGDLTDLQSHDILESMKPFLKAGKIPDAVRTGINGILATLDHQPISPSLPTHSQHVAPTFESILNFQGLGAELTPTEKIGTGILIFSFLGLFDFLGFYFSSFFSSLFLTLFLLPFFALFPGLILGARIALMGVVAHLGFFLISRIWLHGTKSGRDWRAKKLAARLARAATHQARSSKDVDRSSSDTSSSSSDSSSSSSDSGGSSGGGGSSDSW